MEEALHFNSTAGDQQGLGGGSVEILKGSGVLDRGRTPQYENESQGALVSEGVTSKKKPALTQRTTPRKPWA